MSEKIEGGAAEMLANLKRKRQVRVVIPIGFEGCPDVGFDGYDLNSDEQTYYMVEAVNVLLRYLNLRGVTNERYLETSGGKKYPKIVGYFLVDCLDTELEFFNELDSVKAFLQETFYELPTLYELRESASGWKWLNEISIPDEWGVHWEDEPEKEVVR